MQFVVWALDMVCMYMLLLQRKAVCVRSGVELKRWLPRWIPAASDPWRELVACFGAVG